MSSPFKVPLVEYNHAPIRVRDLFDVNAEPDFDEQLVSGAGEIGKG